MVRSDRLSFTAVGEPELLGAVGVSGEFFQVLGVPALVGRTLLPFKTLGIYGITAYSVAQRTREMGLRMALGAQPGAVLGMVLKEVGILAGVGLAAGLVLALAATRVMASLLFGVPATDPTTFAAVAFALAVVAGCGVRPGPAGYARGPHGGSPGRLRILFPCHFICPVEVSI